jgi:membrane protein implicated in regulation of membrane protease activity
MPRVTYDDARMGTATPAGVVGALVVAIVFAADGPAAAGVAFVVVVVVTIGLVSRRRRRRKNDPWELRPPST